MPERVAVLRRCHCVALAEGDPLAQLRFASFKASTHYRPRLHPKAQGTWVLRAIINGCSRLRQKGSTEAVKRIVLNYLLNVVRKIRDRFVANASRLEGRSAVAIEFLELNSFCTVILEPVLPLLM